MQYYSSLCLSVFLSLSLSWAWENLISTKIYSSCHSKRPQSAQPCAFIYEATKVTKVHVTCGQISVIVSTGRTGAPAPSCTPGVSAPASNAKIPKVPQTHRQTFCNANPVSEDLGKGQIIFDSYDHQTSEACRNDMSTHMSFLIF